MLRHALLLGLVGVAGNSESIPVAEVDVTDPALALDNGVYFLRHAPFSGDVVTYYPHGALKQRAQYRAGKQEGLTTSFYETGEPRDERWYRSNKAAGLHRGWWAGGLPKFEFTYVDDRREGVHRQWYASGHPYTELTYRNDREDGMQRAFRENGKPYINYEAKDGFTYGLKKSALCGELIDGKEKER